MRDVSTLIGLLERRGLNRTKMCTALRTSYRRLDRILQDPGELTIKDIIVISLNLGCTPEEVLRIAFGTPNADYSFFEHLE